MSSPLSRGTPARGPSSHGHPGAAVQGPPRPTSSLKVPTASSRMSESTLGLGAQQFMEKSVGVEAEEGVAPALQEQPACRAIRPGHSPEG